MRARSLTTRPLASRRCAAVRSPECSSTSHKKSNVRVWAWGTTPRSECSATAKGCGGLTSKPASESMGKAMFELRQRERQLLLPALTTAHSHAFQRKMRGLAQRRDQGAKDDFWSWRGQMYEAARLLDPESIGQISRVAFRELK